jgi:short-subunit dehydrogenase
MPNERAGDPGNRGSTIADLAGAAGPGSVDGRHLLLVGAGPGLGMAVARRFAVGGYQVTLVARSTDRLRDLAGTLADTGAKISTIAADASDPDGLGTRMRELYLGNGAPGVIVYNAVMGAPDRLLSSSVAHLQAAYSVDVISAIVVAQVAAPAMRAAGFGTILVTGGGFADHPIPALATVSLGKAALRSAATMLGADLEPDGIRVATLTIAGQIVTGTSFDPERITERYWEVVHVDGPWQAEFRSRSVSARMAAFRRPGGGGAHFRWLCRDVRREMHRTAAGQGGRWSWRASLEGRTPRSCSRVPQRRGTCARLS